MQKEKKQRRIDFTKEEMAQMSHCAVSTFDERLKKAADKYEFNKDDFKRDGTRYNFFPPEYAPLLALLIKNQSNDPTQSRKPEDKNADDVKYFNETVQKDVEELPPALKEIVVNQPWYKTSQQIVQWIDLLVEELVQMVFNLTSMHDDDIGAAMRELCRSLDTMNYNLFRGQQIKEMAFQQNGAEQDYIFEEIYKELSLLSEKDRKQKFTECPDFEAIYNHHFVRNQRCDQSNLSIDKGISVVIKCFMEMINAGAIREGDSLLQEYLSAKEVVGLKIENEEMERDLYYEDYAEAWLHSFAHIHATPGKAQFSVANGRKWKSVVEKVADGTFCEDYHEEYLKKKQQLQMDVDVYEQLIMKLSPEMQRQLGLDYKAHYESIKLHQREMETVVKRFIGQALMEFLQ